MAKVSLETLTNIDGFYAAALVDLTGIDEENIITSLFAINNNVKNVITKITRFNYNVIAKNASAS